MDGQLAFVEENAQSLQKESVKLLALVKADVYAAGLVHKVPIRVLWKQMWMQIKSYFVISSKYFVTIVFGWNAHTTKYFGATYSMKKDDRFGPKFLKKFVKAYGLVER